MPEYEEEFEEWFRQQDPEPIYGYPWNFEDHKHTLEQWKIRFFSTKLGYLQVCRKKQEKIPNKCSDCKICLRCHGLGKVYEGIDTWWDDNASEHSSICPNCKGTGKRETK